MFRQFSQFCILGYIIVEFEWRGNLRGTLGFGYVREHTISKMWYRYANMPNDMMHFNSNDYVSVIPSLVPGPCSSCELFRFKKQYSKYIFLIYYVMCR